MPSESVAKEMLRDVILGTESEKNAIVISTFSSHLARLKSIIEFGKKLHRKILFLGRSLHKYVTAGEDIGIVNFSKDVEIVKYGKHIRKKLKLVEKNRQKYLLVVTGHQGEPKATLSKMAKGTLKFNFKPEDHIVFSCKVIPTPTNIENRERLENDLKRFKVRIFKDIHVSGHAAREDLRDLINLVKPNHIIPAHGELKMTSALVNLATQMGYSKNVHLMQNGQHIKLKRSL
jgi:ribonuclease J